MDVVLAVAIGSVMDLDLSRLCFAKNLDNFEPCGDDEDDEGVLRDCRPLMENVMVVVEKGVGLRGRRCQEGPVTVVSEFGVFISNCFRLGCGCTCERALLREKSSVLVLQSGNHNLSGLWNNRRPAVLANLNEWRVSPISTGSVLIISEFDQ